MKRVKPTKESFAVLDKILRERNLITDNPEEASDTVIGYDSGVIKICDALVLFDSIDNK